MNPSLARRAREILAKLTRDLLAELPPSGHWIGELSGSALSTAVATIALGEIDRRSGRTDHAPMVKRGLRWLADHVNPDGGWGDTVRSRSNLSTTSLAWASFGAARADDAFAPVLAGARAWLVGASGSLDRLVSAIEDRYGDDRTFSVPIVLTLALSGRLGPDGWRRVRPLPFELAVLPRAWFGFLGLPVVSYALPALIALGQAIHRHAPSRNPLVRALRQATASSSLGLLHELQPPNGGFLEATPLTAFVAMSLASMGGSQPVVVERAARFLRQSVRPDGSWPIDTNLATWVTTLAVKALRHQPNALPPAARHRLRDWLQRQQFTTRHPYTGAAPGGWAWTDLPGGVPDADDTAGALLALQLLAPDDPSTGSAAASGVRWLLDLQNSDGGIPTFCRGWGRLPFDRSAPDLTAHALRAWRVWEPRLPGSLRNRTRAAIRRAKGFLGNSQKPDGSWIPLWFGNESAGGEVNAVYGTSQVLAGWPAEQSDGPSSLVFSRALAFLGRAQNAEGGWGGAAGAPPSVEETAIALAALAPHQGPGGVEPGSIERGVSWLVDRLESEYPPPAAPIGLYFARLWYFERLYPLLFATDALGACASGPA